ncbi:MAG: hypothetical protein JXA92_07195, partial [candidate division Zixibacteria bacterium]|nr:hypothetical protein [candidate division Zixibacteria bacterium]
MKIRFNNSIIFGAVLNLLIPGLGHVFWKEYLFGLFIFLIMLITSILFFVSFLVNLPLLVKVLMFGLPAVFYFFSFFDLARTIRTRKSKLNKTIRAVIVFLLVGVAYQVLAPNAAGNFIIHNFPKFFTLQNNRYSPVYSKGDMLKASRLAYSVDIVGFKERFIHTLPKRFDFICYNSGGEARLGVVVGLPGEEIQIIDGEVVATDYALFD